MKKKLLGIIVLGLLLSGNAYADLKKNWNLYERAYQSGFNYCIDKWMKIGNFTQNPKVFMDIEHCTYDEDVKALEKFGFGPYPDAMNDLIHKKYVSIFNLAKEMSSAAVDGNRGVQVERFFEYRDREYDIYLNQQWALINR